MIHRAMNRFGLLTLLTALMLPVLSFAQNQVDSLSCDACVQQLSSQCPNGVKEGWTVNSVVAAGDTVTVEIEIVFRRNGVPFCWRSNLKAAKKLIICLCHPTNLAQFLQMTDSAEVNLVYCVTKLIR